MRLGRQFLPFRLMCYVSRANHHVMDRSSMLPVVNALRAILSTTENWTSTIILTCRNMLGPSPHRWLLSSLRMCKVGSHTCSTELPLRSDCDVKNMTIFNERVPHQPSPTSPFRPEACAPDARGYAKVVRGPAITVPPATGAPIEPSWVRKPTGTPKVPALMSLDVKPPTKNTQFGSNSTHENYMWMLQHV